MALLQLAHQAAQGAVGAVERELAGDGLALQRQRLRHLAAHRGDERVALLRAEQVRSGLSSPRCCASSSSSVRRAVSTWVPITVASSPSWRSSRCTRSVNAPLAGSK